MSSRALLPISCVVILGACSGARPKPTVDYATLAKLSADGKECEFPDGTRAPSARPEKISGDAPRFTPEAIRDRVRGTAKVECVIRKSGEVTSCHMLQSVPHMDDAIVETLETWRMEPVLCGGVATDVSYTTILRLWVPPQPPPERFDPGMVKVSREGDCEYPDGRRAKLERPVKLSGDAPQHTNEAREARVEGTAVVECIVRTSGAMTNCWVPKPLFYMEEELIRTLSTWRMKPATCDGQPTDLWFSFPVELRLDSTGPARASDVSG